MTSDSLLCLEPVTDRVSLLKLFHAKLSHLYAIVLYKHCLEGSLAEVLLSLLVVPVNLS